MISDEELTAMRQRYERLCNRLDRWDGVDIKLEPGDVHAVDDIPTLIAEVERLGQLALRNHENCAAEQAAIAERHNDDLLAAELDRVQEGWDAAKDEIDGLRARMAELEAIVDADLAEIERRAAADQAILDAANGWRQALIWDTGVTRDAYATRLADTQDALIAAVDAMGTAQRDGREAT